MCFTKHAKSSIGIGGCPADLLVCYKQPTCNILNITSWCLKCYQTWPYRSPFIFSRILKLHRIFTKLEGEVGRVNGFEMFLWYINATKQYCDNMFAMTTSLCRCVKSPTRVNITIFTKVRKMPYGFLAIVF